jgi:hypothetical protein
VSGAHGSAQKTLVIHSGTFKTGSTAIQLYLDRAETAGLLREAGVTYPQTGRSTGVQHSNLVAEIRGEGVVLRRNGGWERLLSEVSTSEVPTTIVSHEGLSTLESEHLERIGELCRNAGVTVRWVQYVRDQPSLYNAFYVERIITMRPEMIDVINEPYEDFGTWSPTDLSFMRYATFIDKVRAGIPEADIVLRPFVRDHLVEGDSVADFCATVGIPFVPQHGGKANVGAGWRTVETARRLLPLVRDAKLGRKARGAPNRKAARQRWEQIIRGELITAAWAAGWNAETARYMTPEHHERLIAEYHDENVRLAAQADFPWLDIVEKTPMKPRNIGDFNDVPGEEMMAVLSRVLRTVYEMPPEIAAMIPATPAAPAPARTLPRRAAGAVRRRLRP